MRRGTALLSLHLEPQVRERRGARKDIPTRERTFGRCPLQGRVVGGMAVVGEVTFGEWMRHVFGEVPGWVPIVVFRGGCARVVLLGLAQRR